MTDRIEASASLDPEAWMVELTSRMDAMDYDGVISHARTLMEAYKRDAVDAERYRTVRNLVTREGRGYRLAEVGTDQQDQRPLKYRWYLDSKDLTTETLDAWIDAARAPKEPRNG